MKTWTSGVGRHIESNLKIYMLLCGIYIFGLCAGAMAAGTISNQSAETARGYLSGALKGIGQGNAEILFNSFFSLLRPVVLIWLLGFSRYGVWFINLVLGLKGAFTGFSAGLIIRLYNVKGVALAAAGIVPQHIIIIPLMLFICLSAMCNSQNVRGNPFGEKNRKQTLRYLELLLSAAAFAFIAAAIDSYVTSALLKYLTI